MCYEYLFMYAIILKLPSPLLHCPDHCTSNVLFCNLSRAHYIALFFASLAIFTLLYFLQTILVVLLAYSASSLRGVLVFTVP